MGLITDVYVATQFVLANSFRLPPHPHFFLPINSLLTLRITKLDLPNPELVPATVCIASEYIKGPAMLRARYSSTEYDPEVLDIEGCALREREGLVGASLQVRLESVTRIRPRIRGRDGPLTWSIAWNFPLYWNTSTWSFRSSPATVSSRASCPIATSVPLVSPSGAWKALQPGFWPSLQGRGCARFLSSSGSWPISGKDEASPTENHCGLGGLQNAWNEFIPWIPDLWRRSQPQRLSTTVVSPGSSRWKRSDVFPAPGS